MSEQKPEENQIHEKPLMESRHAHLGSILGILIIVLILIVAGLYLWGGMLNKEKIEIEQRQIINNEPETQRAEADVQIFNTLSPSDELDTIMADLDGTNLDSLDADLITIDAELEAGLQ